MRLIFVKYGLGVVLIGLALVLALDWRVSNKLLFSTQPSFAHEPSPVRTRTVVAFMGTQVSAETQTRQLRKTWSRYGRVVVPVFPREAFDRAAIIRATFEKLREMGAKELCLIGSSGGGQMVAEFIRYNRELGSEFTITGVVGDDIPMDSSDLVDTRAGMVNYWLAGWVQNWLSSLFWGASWDPPAPAPEANLELLAEHHELSKTYPLSGWGDQVRAILDFYAVFPCEFAGIPFIYLASTPSEDAADDGVVKHSSIPKWLRAFQAPDSAVVRVQSPHAEYVAFPVQWENAFSHALAKLYPNG